MYVQDTTIADWEKVIDTLNSNYSISFGYKGAAELVDKINKEYIINSFSNPDNENGWKSATIILNGIEVNCHFFLFNQIEFDFHPICVNSIDDLNEILSFMENISDALEKQVTLTSENEPEFPLIKVDRKIGIRKILKENEAITLRKTKWSLHKQVTIWVSRLVIALFPGFFKKRLIERANEPYKATNRDKHLW